MLKSEAKDETPSRSRRGPVTLPITVELWQGLRKALEKADRLKEGMEKVEYAGEFEVDGGKQLLWCVQQLNILLGRAEGVFDGMSAAEKTGKKPATGKKPRNKSA